MNRRPLFIALVLTTLLLTTHLYALSHYLYWYHRWFDIPMHILGGIAIGSFFLAFFSSQRIGVYFFLMFGVVVVWEVFENIAGISTNQPHYWLDTFKDIFDGMLGSVITLFIARRTWR